MPSLNNAVAGLSVNHDQEIVEQRNPDATIQTETCSAIPDLTFAGVAGMNYASSGRELIRHDKKILVSSHHPWLIFQLFVCSRSR